VKHEVVARIAKAVDEVTKERGSEGGVASAQAPTIERPKKPEHGDYATNVALAMAKRLGQKPIELAQALKVKLEADPFFARVDVAGPGFLNMKLAPPAFHASLATILAQGKSYGRAPAATGERINLEFVSANPTGPLHMGHARSAVTGDAIGRLLEARGHRVTREYYVNDFGNQVKLLAESVIARAKGKEIPDGGYGAEYVTALAKWADAHAPKLIAGGDVEKLAPRLVAAMLAGYPGELGIKQTLRDLGIQFDVWASEGFLHQTGQVDRAIETLRAAGYLKEEDGALFFATTQVGEKSEKSEKTPEKRPSGDDKDRVLRKRDGGHTYFASDIAYHKDKIDRGFDRLIDVWGADHHGYIPRVRAALRALELPADRFEVLLVQMVALLKNGEPYKMGKRLGNFITIDEVLEEIDGATGKKGSGRDALRYFFLARRPDAQLDIDVDLAKKQSLENPVYYLQYGHARLCAIQRMAAAECGLDPENVPLTAEALAALSHPDELAMIALLGELPHVLAEAASERAPNKLVAFLTTVAQTFQSYYTRLKKENDTILPRKPERADGSWKQRDGGAYPDKVRARLAWVRAIRDVYAAGLMLLGIDAPEKMARAATPIEADASTTTDATAETTDDET
jgi:arginyl-tRNA synthetase